MNTVTPARILATTLALRSARQTIVKYRSMLTVLGADYWPDRQQCDHVIRQIDEAIRDEGLGP